MTAQLRQQLQFSLGTAYTIDRELGGGGMSRTYVARDEALGRAVVVKILSPDLAAGVSVERFRREIQLAAALQHPHIVPVLSSGDADGLPWFTMPYVEGESLRARLGQGPLRVAEATGILRDVARALEFAHSHGVVHRDIKPDNVLLAGSSATVTDFGIAKAISVARTGGGNATLTQAGTSLGTPAYMAPEQAAGDPTLDPRSDIYSFGIMAFELLAGHPPFEGSTPSKLLSAHFSEKPRDLRSLRPDTPAPLAELVMRCLEKDPSARPQSASDLVRVLDTVTSSGAADAAPAALLGGQMRLGRAVALWAAATALVALTAWAATSVVGLPDWVFPGSLGVMLAGLPVIGATWYVQSAARRAYTATPTYTPGGSPSIQGTFATMAIKASPHVSWRRTWLGGSIAVGAFVALVIAFMVMRALGIGPAGSLIGAGKMSAGETLVVADFRGPAGDSTLGATVAEALRTDLGQSSSLNVMTRAAVRELLRLMQRPTEAPVSFDIAREIATRQGAKAVLDGEVVKLGGSYVVSARLVSSADGSELAKFRETAKGEDAIIGSLGKLSRDVRGKIGESLKNIHDTKPLERVTTPSLAALRKYMEGNRLIDMQSDFDRGLALLEEAVGLDSGFAMAWRKISVTMTLVGGNQTRQMSAIATAYRHRDRLTDSERLLTEGYYFSYGPAPDREKAIAAYETAIEADSANSTALNNVAILYGQKRDYERAERAYRRAAAEKRPFYQSISGLQGAQLRRGKIAAAESTATLFAARLPNSANLWEASWSMRWAHEDYAGADSIAKSVFEKHQSPQAVQRSALGRSSTAYLHGRARDGLRWAVESNGSVYRRTQAQALLLQMAIDSATYAAMYLENRDGAGKIIRAALAKTSISQIPAAQRPWNNLARLAATMRDAALAREAMDGFERDLPNIGSLSPDGDRARVRGYAALAAGRYDDALASVRDADRQFAMTEPVGTITLAQAFDLAGKPDSAIAYFELAVAAKDYSYAADTHFRAGSYKRLGELYEAKGDTAKAESNYQKFVDLWKDADPELQPKVREVRDRLARLRHGRG